ncbi:MAG: hypothetical protein U0353_00005, partial [Sandaracinus sp.]
MRRALHTLLTLLALSSSACLSVEPPEGIGCSDGRCPVGWYCHSDMRCRRTPETPHDGGPDAAIDAGPVDAYVLDAPADARDGALDAPFSLDASELDAALDVDGGLDGGPASPDAPDLDATSLDATSLDATSLDAASLDAASAPDAVVDLDAWAPDAFSPDAWVPVDAYGPDAGCVSAASCPEPPYAHMVASCVSGTCGFTCATGYHDLDGSLSNGCEYACVPTMAPGSDPPNGTDDDCDGADGVIGGTIYVSPDGLTGGNGLSPATAVTLERAFVVATLAGTPRILLLQSGTYATTAALVAPSGVRLFGRYDMTYRARSARTLVSSSTPRTLLLGSGVTFAADGVDFRSGNNTAAGGYTATIFATAATLSLTDCRVTAGLGGDGTDGGPGLDRSGGTAASGEAGGPGTWATSAGVGAGVGPGSGGNGALYSSSGCVSGGAGQGSGCASGVSGGACTDAMCTCMTTNTFAMTDGAPGRAGCAGSQGSHGLGASAPGSLTAAGWSPAAPAFNGGTGTVGDRGGGGGGGAGAHCMNYGAPDGAAGGGGGQGGAGGAGGGGGSGGQSGGASIAILAFDSTVQLSGGVVATMGGGAGGDGGAAGRGQLGGPGGAGGDGGEVAIGCGGPTYVRGGRGGAGGAGGEGGAGGCGGGGAG